MTLNDLQQLLFQYRDTAYADFSAGLIPYLNIAVGLVVCCTIYSFYTLFRKGDL